jgi:1,6-anhydro-N-acetylmuramate kinase
MVSAIGLNSGSSFDSIDAVLIDIEIGWDGLPVRPTFKAGRSYAWPATILSRALGTGSDLFRTFILEEGKKH